MKILIASGIIFSVFPLMGQISYPIVDTGQKRCYNNFTEIAYPKSGQAFYGQDAQYSGNQPVYKDNGDGTVSDLVTGLMWTQDPGSKKTYAQAIADASKCRVGGYKDWRLPTIKELYSLIDFSGTDIPPWSKTANTPFINKRYFKFKYGNTASERIIDSQFATSTKYVSTTMGGNATMFGVNFADGRIKGYPLARKTFYVLYVRGNPEYGKNKFKVNSNGTITDEATGLMWTQADSGTGMDWQQALKYAESSRFAAYSDWRLPNAKELQSLVDYTRSPDTTVSPAINPLFRLSSIRNAAGGADYPCYWTSTTHKSERGGSTAAYIAFGRALGWMRSPRFRGKPILMDVHGAGAQRSDPKSGDPAKFPYGRGPQGDVIRINNYVLLVRGGKADINRKGPKLETRKPSRPQASQGLWRKPGR